MDCKEGIEKFKDILNQPTYIDKTNIINDLNELIRYADSKNICITKPRRFGKTSITAMLSAYYSKGIESNIIFDRFKVSSCQK